MGADTPPWERSATHLATVRGHRDIPVRRHGRFWWCSYQVALGIVWGGRDVTDLRPIHPAPQPEVSTP